MLLFFVAGIVFINVDAVIFIADVIKVDVAIAVIFLSLVGIVFIVVAVIVVAAV